MRMNWWRTFLQNRKQNDRIKLEVLGILLGVLSSLLAIGHGVTLYQKLQTRMEYVISSAGSIRQQNDRIARIWQLTHVRAVSRQAEGTIVAGDTWGTMELPYLQLSEDYLQAVYGISTGHSAMKVYYLNTAAWQQLLQNAQMTDSADTQMMLTNQKESGDNGTILVEAAGIDLGTDTPFAVTTGDSLALEKEQTGIRICFDKRSIDNSQLWELQNIGGTIENAEAVVLEQKELEFQELHIKYLGCIALLCLASAWLLHKYGK